MDYVSPIFPLHQSDELFQISSTSFQQNTIKQDNEHMLLSTTPLENSVLIPIKQDKIRCRKSSADPNHNDERSNESKKRKMMHRDIERQRRQEMTTLYSSLRSLLPVEYLKGKRSISDHVNETVNYIKHLQKKIQDLGEKREALKGLSDLSSPVVERGNLQSCRSSCITFHPCRAGVEVIVSSGLREEEMPLSRVLKVLVEEGLSIVSYISTKRNEKSLHTIVLEVSDSQSLDLSNLQQKLTVTDSIQSI